MIIQKYDVTLKSLQKKDIETVRIWRNMPNIRSKMMYRGVISPEMQLKWFNSVNNDNNYYFVIYFQGVRVGLINCKDIDWKSKVGENGILIGNKTFSNSLYTMYSMFLFKEFCFRFLQLDSVFLRILKDNYNANNLFGHWGFRKESSVDNDCFIYTVQKNDFFIKTQKMISMAEEITNSKKTEVFIEKIDYKYKNIDLIIKNVKDLENVKVHF